MLLVTVGPAVVLTGLAVGVGRRRQLRRRRTLGAGSAAWVGWLLLAAVPAVLGYLAAGVEARALATAVIGGRAEGRPLRLRESIAVARRRFWSVLGAAGPRRRPVRGRRVRAGLVARDRWPSAAWTPIGYGGLAAVGVVGRHAVRLRARRDHPRRGRSAGGDPPLRPPRAGARKRLAVVVTLFSVLASLVVLFGLGVGRGHRLAGRRPGRACRAASRRRSVVPLAAALVFALGTLTFLRRRRSPRRRPSTRSSRSRTTRGASSAGRREPLPVVHAWDPWFTPGPAPARDRPSALAALRPRRNGARAAGALSRRPSVDPELRAGGPRPRCPRWWASSWRIVIRTSSARSSGSGKSSSSGRRKRMIRVGTGTQSPPHSSSGTPSYRPYSVSSGPRPFSRRCSRRGLVGDDDRDARRAPAGTGAGWTRWRGRRAGRSRRGLCDGARRRAALGTSAVLGHRARILAAMTLSRRRAGAPLSRSTWCWRPPPDPALEPEGFLAGGGRGSAPPLPRLGRPGRRRPGSLLVPGLLAAGLVVGAGRAAAGARAADVRRRTCAATGCPTRRRTDTTSTTLAEDAVAVAEGVGARSAPTGASCSPGTASGRSWPRRPRRRSGERCAGLVLVDGGLGAARARRPTSTWTSSCAALDEPPEVLRSMDAWLADRRAFDPASWDADQERAARDAVVETAAGHVVRAVRPHVVAALVRTMFAYDPAVAPGSRARRPSRRSWRWRPAIPAPRLGGAAAGRDGARGGRRRSDRRRGLRRRCPQPAAVPPGRCDGGHPGRRAVDGRCPGLSAPWR